MFQKSLPLNLPMEDFFILLKEITCARISGAMGTVRAFPKRSEGPQGKRWNCPRGIADVTYLVKFI
ncbi:MAG: hypothetical protein ACOYVK_17215 [Bacillota bacterium]